ncbi:monoheme cytochrome C [Muricauda sp. SP22]|nr:monoheme cytochrome C [Muricauda sp. SP22]
MSMKPNFEEQIKAFVSVLAIFLLLMLVLFGGLFYFNNRKPKINLEEIPVEISEEDFDKVENGIHLATGFIEDEGMQVTIQNCTGCHSAKLVTQNRMSREGWKATIVWMQETQNLWDLGANEKLILNYLSKNYAPTNKGRRQNLEVAEWYELN